MPLLGQDVAIVTDDIMNWIEPQLTEQFLELDETKSLDDDHLYTSSVQSLHQFANNISISTALS